MNDESYIEKDFKSIVPADIDLKYEYPGVYSHAGQTFGLLFVRLEKCACCKRLSLCYSVDKHLDLLFPALHSFQKEKQLARHGWGILSGIHNKEWNGWLCTDCEKKEFGHVCRVCKEHNP